MNVVTRALLAILLFTVWPAGWVKAQTNRPIVSSVAVLTIHVSDTNVHQAVFEFLKDVLRLPRQYGPEQLGQRRYAAVYAGNLFIEPCGPYSNMRYPVQDFQALFYGLNSQSDQPSGAVTNALNRLRILWEAVGNDEFRIQDPMLSDGIYLALNTHPTSPSDRDKEAIFQHNLETNQRETLGIEYVQEIWLGYSKSGELDRWAEFLAGSAKVDATAWALDNHQRLRLVKSDVRGVQGIVFKVRSLEAAENYLKKAECFGRRMGGKIELDKKRTFGLLIFFSEE